LDTEKLGQYINKHHPVALPLQIKQFKLGQSNPTFLIIDQKGSKYVVRKKPPGQLLSKTAHAVEREYKILKALGTKSSVPVPQVYLLCEDTQVIGTPFYVMQFLQGRIFSDVSLPTVPNHQKAEYYYSIVDVLADFHKVNVKQVGLEDYGPPGNFYERQMSTLYKISKTQGAVSDKEGSKVGDLYELETMMRWFRANQVKSETTLMHGDYKTDNVFHPEKGQVIGILDWELSTLGHPLADLANLLQPWYIPHGTRLGGFYDAPRPLPVPEADELIKRYCEKVGRPYPIPGWDFCVAFSFFKMAVITQGVAARVKRNQASSGFATEIAKLFQPLSMRVHQIIQQQSKL
ncbi:kinase-like domain-containing protein, partial [Gorgonomyces haynaldii]